MTTAEMARGELTNPQPMRIILASREQERLIEHRPHPTNPRQNHFMLTEGAAVTRRHRAVEQDWLVGALTGLDHPKLKILTTVAIRLIRQIDES
jgi:hypothetical protein